MKLTEVKVPFENVNDPTARLLTWKVTRGAAVKAGDILAEMETTKAVFNVPAPVAGYVDYKWSEGEEVPIGETLCRITDEQAAPVEIRNNPPIVPAAGSSVAEPVISAKARALMVEHGLEASLFTGLKFIKEADVRQCLEAREKSPSPAKMGPEKSDPAPLPMDEPGRKIVLSRAKLYENRELLAADRAGLKSTLFHLCPAAGLQDACLRESPSISRLAIILFEVVQLLKEFRQFNAAMVNDDGFLYQHINIGCAVDMDRGLKVLVIREAEAMNFPQLNETFQNLLVKYATDTLEVADLTGTTFTVTDLAQEGVFTFDPLINVRTAAILGVGGEVRIPGQSLGFMLSCAFDHRLNSGRQAGEFLRALSARLVAQRDSLRNATRDDAPCCGRCLQTTVELKRLNAALVQSVEPPGFICSICLSGF